ncbi:gliding motility lipoprotein GldB [Maribacter algicola]|uniref:Gliding motility lipoprotein GldB n=1 Tax=Meishania litoralis TaxID=3434685 RepID=A0ACC7LM04_9FLAO
MRKLLDANRSIFAVLLISMMIFACNDNDRVADEIAKINIDLQVSRFDREFAEAKPSDLPALKKTYPYLFPVQFADSVWVAKLRDTLQIELLSEVGKTFVNFEKEQQDLESLFKHIKFYFPNYDIPKIVTVINDVDYQNRVILTDSLLFIELDSYLGADHKFYRGIQRYIAQGLDRKFMVSDVATAFANKFIRRPRERMFLSKIIYYGKILYLKDKIMPFASDALKIGYSQDQVDWAQVNEEPIWRNFIEQEHLYSTDNKLDTRFLDPAPFSKFGLELDNESPGRIGRYMGWQIVRALMERNEITLQQLIALPEEEIFKKSNYKPRK